MSRSVVKFGNVLVPAGLQQADRVAATCWIVWLEQWSRGLADAGVVDVHVEVDADPLEEAVVEADEANFDRDLQILQAAELLQAGRRFLRARPAFG